MPSPVTQFRLAISCPSDVEDDKATIRNVIAEFNSVWGPFLGVNVACLDWRQDATPGMAASPQEIINNEVFKEVDIYVGLMGGRFGTPTAKAGSGTEEEFQEAVSEARKSGRPDILFYFRRTGDLFAIDLVQASKVAGFRDKMSRNDGVLWAAYDDEADLAYQVRMHISRKIQNLVGKMRAESAVS